MRKTKRFAALALTASLFVVAACGDDEEESTSTEAPAATEAPSATEAPAGTEAPAAGAVSACQVTDVGGVDDKGFNQSAYAGLQQAEADLGAEIALLESASDADYAPNIQAFLDKGCDDIITVGFLLGGATADAAIANPDQQFAIIDSDANDNAGTPDDFADDVNLENVRALNFATDEPSFIAGYLAAGMSETGKVATYGGINIPPVTIFMTGFLNGVNYYNEQKGTAVEVLGWDGTEGSFAGNFESLDDGKKLAQGFADEGADIIFPVAGPVGLGSSAYAKEVGGIRIIGVDVDMYVSNDKEKEVYLTSVLKNIDASVFDTVKNVSETGDAGDDYVGTFANGGVGIADFHDQAGDVPDELKAEIEQLVADFTAGTMKAG
ncbi:MAG: BMP family ABC transporter substrate-binding protein [Actinobacteria bacterium]|nr:BMP family ABC transporter substrate-binding protein [Actinomycetota bacterium]